MHAISKGHDTEMRHKTKHIEKIFTKLVTEICTETCASYVYVSASYIGIL